MQTHFILTGGGTQGHINPHLALLEYFEEHKPHIRLAYIGTADGLESRLIRTKKIPFHAIYAGKLRRNSLLKSLFTTINVIFGFFQSFIILFRTKPSVVFATGGYVSIPVAFAAFLLGIPVIIHEQTTQAGFANKVIGIFAKQVLLSFSCSASYFGDTPTTLVGNPVRAFLTEASATGKTHFHFLEKLPTIYITGGSQGAHSINRMIGKLLPKLLEFCNIVHQSGNNPATKDYDWLVQQQADLPVVLRKRYYCLPYLDEERQREAYSKCDFVISRAGAGTLTELAVLKIPSLLIPLPSQLGTEQLHNARYFEEMKAAVVYIQHDLEEAPEKLVAILKHLLIGNRQLMDTMRKNLAGLVPANGTKNIATILLAYLK